MSAARKVAAVVTNTQAAMLDLMREALGPLSMRAVQDRLEMCHTQAQRNFESLRTRMLVDEVFADAATREGVRGRMPMLFVISRSGSRALARHKCAVVVSEQVIVQAPRHNTYGTTYLPPTQVYYRNEGNKHIGSRGFSC